MIFCKNYIEPPFDKREILRYAGCRGAADEILPLADSCIDEVKNKLTYKTCYSRLDVKISGDLCDFGVFSCRSRSLALNLRDCRSAVLFAASVGFEIDRLITRYGRISPARALMLDAIGAERIEALCDAFCADIEREYNQRARPRFSPGYGDLPLEMQGDIFKILTPEKNIGLFLTDSMLMSPSKSVTAIVGLSNG